MDAVSGVHLHRLILGTSVLNLNDQRIDFTDIIFDCPYMNALVFVTSNFENWTVKWCIYPPYDHVKSSIGQGNSPDLIRSYALGKAGDAGVIPMPDNNKAKVFPASENLLYHQCRFWGSGCCFLLCIRNRVTLELIKIAITYMNYDGFSYSVKKSITLIPSNLGST